MISPTRATGMYTEAYTASQQHTSDPSSSKSPAPKSSAPKSPASKSPAPKSASSLAACRAVDHIFVLWGEHFFESAAVIFVTMLREAGICVKLVGVHGLQAAGYSRISVQADLSMTAALELAGRVCSIILPCNQAALRRMGNDPRLHQLFQTASANGAYFFVPPELPMTSNSLKFLGIPPQQVVQYAPEDELISFVQQLAPQLARVISADDYAAALASLVFTQPN